MNINKAAIYWAGTALSTVAALGFGASTYKAAHILYTPECSTNTDWGTGICTFGNAIGEVATSAYTADTLWYGNTAAKMVTLKQNERGAWLAIPAAFGIASTLSAIGFGIALKRQ